MRIDLLLVTAVLASFAIVTAAPAAGDYVYSYTFGDGYNVSGLLAGTIDPQNAAVIDVSSVLTMSFDGAPLSDPIMAAQFGSPVPQISADVDLNAFEFYDASGEFSCQRIFNPSDGSFEFEEGLAISNDGSSYTILAHDLGMSQAAWSFEAVPEPSYSTLLAGGFSCFLFVSALIKKLRG